MNYYKTNNKILSSSIKGADTIDYNKFPDLLDILFNHWITQKENYNRLKADHERGDFELSRSIVMEEFGIKDTKAKNLIKRFVDNEIIKLKKRGNNSTKKSVYTYLSALEKDQIKDQAKTKQKTKQRPSKTLENQYIEIDERPSKDQVKDQVNDHSKKELIKRVNKNNIYSRVITRLNESTTKNYKSTTKNTVKHINARLNEGFTEDDFYKVIDIKTKEWLNDTTMNQYLRPDTLFGTKFESYLNQTIQDIQEDPKEIHQEIDFTGMTSEEIIKLMASRGNN